MTTEQIRAAYQASPFRPFTIHTTDGASHFVPRADLLSIGTGTGSQTCTVANENDDGWTVVDVQQITRLVFASSRTAGAP